MRSLDTLEGNRVSHVPSDDRMHLQSNEIPGDKTEVVVLVTKTANDKDERKLPLQKSNADLHQIMSESSTVIVTPMS